MNNVNDGSQVKSLKFKDELAALILAGKKDVTWRLFDDKDIRPHDELMLVNSDTGTVFAQAIVVSIREKRFRDLVASDFEGHERYRDDAEMYETYRTYYGDRVTPDTVVKIIAFKLDTRKTSEQGLATAVGMCRGLAAKYTHLYVYEVGKTPEWPPEGIQESGSSNTCICSHLAPVAPHPYV